MSNMIKWTNQGGADVETNDLPENIEGAKAAGWKRKASAGKTDEEKDAEKAEKAEKAAAKKAEAEAAKAAKAAK